MVFPETDLPSLAFLLQNSGCSETGRKSIFLFKTSWPTLSSEQQNISSHCMTNPHILYLPKILRSDVKMLFYGNCTIKIQVWSWITVKCIFMLTIQRFEGMNNPEEQHFKWFVAWKEWIPICTVIDSYYEISIFFPCGHTFHKFTRLLVNIHTFYCLPFASCMWGSRKRGSRCCSVLNLIQASLFSSGGCRRLCLISSEKWSLKIPPWAVSLPNTYIQFMKTPCKSAPYFSPGFLFLFPIFCWYWM